MSITMEAYKERKWRCFPVLRQAQENKQVPSDNYGLTSVSDNMFDSLDRLLQISVLAAEYPQNIKESAQYSGPQEMCEDLLRLEKELEHASLFFKSKSHIFRIPGTSHSLGILDVLLKCGTVRRFTKSSLK